MHLSRDDNMNSASSLSAVTPYATADSPTVELLPTIELRPMQSNAHTSDPQRFDPAVGELAPGVVLRGRYVLQEVIGRGGHSIVFRAKDRHRIAAEDPNSGQIALKALHPAQRANERANARLAREFRQMQTLAHPNIARVFDLDCDGDIWFVSMELVDGKPVSERLRQSIGIAEAMHIIRGCSEALDYAHAMGIVHGDLKPSNVLLAKDGRVKLIDFGSVPSRSSVVEGESNSTWVATPSYASPQILAGMRAEPRDDIFSLACLSYAILGDGERPFGDKSSLEAHRARLCPAVIPGMPVDVFGALVRSLAGDRELRASSAEEFHRDLLGPAALLPRKVSAGGAARRGASDSLRRMSLAGLAVAAVCAAVLVLPAAQKIIAGPTAAPISIPPPPAALVSAATVAPAQTPTDSIAAEQSGPSTGMEPAPVPRVADLVSFESSSMVAGSAQSMVAIPLKRTRSTHGRTSVEWAVESGSAQPNIDYQPVSPQIVKFNDGEAMRSLFIPLLRTGAGLDARPPRSFSVALRQVGGGARLGTVARIKVTIVPQPMSGGMADQLAMSRYPGN
jgi:predicted Ser/Thr protein kinase